MPSREGEKRGTGMPDISALPLLAKLTKSPHTLPMEGHLRRDKTEAQLKQRVFWPGIYKMVEKYCQECPACQKAGDVKPPKVQLISLCLVVKSSDCITLDITGLFHKARQGISLY